MSFLDDLIDLGTSAFRWFTGNTTGANLARTALTGYALNQVTKSINKENEIKDTPTGTSVDPGVRLQVNPNPEHKIPVVYGTAVLGGIVTDAELTNNNSTMFYCITICEQTGNTNLGAGAASVINFRDIYWDDNRLIFSSDGITVTGWEDRDGNVDNAPNGLIKVYCYSGSSASPTVPLGYTNGSLGAAYTVFPNWGSNHLMQNLIFAIIRVDYNATANVKGLGDVKFKIQNSMYQPGDCLYDYMTNTRYGAGIPAAEIYTS